MSELVRYYRDILAEYANEPDPPDQLLVDVDDLKQIIAVATEADFDAKLHKVMFRAVDDEALRFRCCWASARRRARAAVAAALTLEAALAAHTDQSDL